MAGMNANPQNYQPWLDLDVMEVLGALHDIPKHIEKLFPKFDPDMKDSLEYHIKKIMLVVRLMNVQHGDVVCRLFPYTFENKASTWFFSLE
jgi:hypothetical protein